MIQEKKALFKKYKEYLKLVQFRDKEEQVEPLEVFVTGFIVKMILTE